MSTQTKSPAAIKTPASTNPGLPAFIKLLIGAGGIYSAFLYYGTLQEDVFHYTAADGKMFKQAWFLQAIGIYFSMTGIHY
jgi:hypothetical protein